MNESGIVIRLVAMDGSEFRYEHVTNWETRDDGEIDFTIEAPDGQRTRVVSCMPYIVEDGRGL